MKSSTIALLMTGVAVSASVIQRQGPVPCCFTILVQGSLSGHVGENANGENGFGGDFPQSMYCVLDGSFTDYNGQPCSMLSSNGQFVCEANSTPTNSQFLFAPNGDLLHDSSPNYFACPTPGVATDDSYNIFSDNITDSSRCISITLLTGGFSCAAMGRPPLSSGTPTITPTTTPLVTTASKFHTVTSLAATGSLTFTTASSCPTDISSGKYVAPNLIIPVSPSNPDTAFGTQYNATITPENNTIFAFDIPYAYNGSCALIFLFPFGDDAQSPYSFSGIEEEENSHGGLDFGLLDGRVNNATTFDSLPPIGIDYGKTQVLPGNNYTIAVAPCASGESVAYEVSTVGEMALQYFQSMDRSPIGLYIVPCS